MGSLVAIQHWLYGGMASGLGEVAGGDLRAIFVAMAAAVLFGAVHALMPGHGKTVLVSYHLGQPAKLREGIANGAILVLTHVGLALVLVLAGFAVISRAFAYGGRTPQFEIASGVLIAVIGAFLLWRSLRSEHHAHTQDGKTLALVTGMIPCPLTTKGLRRLPADKHEGDPERHGRTRIGNASRLLEQSALANVLQLRGYLEGDCHDQDCGHLFQ